MLKLADTPSTRKKSIRAWENKSESMVPQGPVELPAEIVAKTVTCYRVGSYTYSNLDDAMAQYIRQQSE